MSPTDQGPRQVVVHLSEAEATGLDEVGIVHALWDDWMKRNLSEKLEDGQRITDYEILGVDLDSRLSNLKAEFGLDSVAFVGYSVKPVKIMYFGWVAGNGEIEGGWVLRKG